MRDAVQTYEDATALSKRGTLTEFEDGHCGNAWVEVAKAQTFTHPRDPTWLMISIIGYPKDDEGTLAYWMCDVTSDTLVAFVIRLAIAEAHRLDGETK